MCCRNHLSPCHTSHAAAPLTIHTSVLPNHTTKSLLTVLSLRHPVWPRRTDTAGRTRYNTARKCAQISRRRVPHRRPSPRAASHSSLTLPRSPPLTSIPLPSASHATHLQASGCGTRHQHPPATLTLWRETPSFALFQTLLASPLPVPRLPAWPCRPAPVAPRGMPARCRRCSRSLRPQAQQGAPPTMH